MSKNRYRYQITVKADTKKRADEIIAAIVFANPELGSFIERVPGADRTA